MFSRISHIGVVVNDLEEAVERWSTLFGLEVRSRGTIGVEGVKNALLYPVGQQGGTFIELIEPVDKSDMSNAIARRLAKSGEGFYHLAVGTADAADAQSSLENAGVALVVQPPVSEGQAPRPIVHPKAANGILIEIVQDSAAH